MDGSDKNRMDGFGEAWKNALSGAEESPSERPWAFVEQQLALDEARRYKQRFLWYRNLAAGLALLLAGLLALFFLKTGNGLGTELAVQGKNTAPGSTQGQANDVAGRSSKPFAGDTGAIAQQNGPAVSHNGEDMAGTGIFVEEHHVTQAAPGSPATGLQKQPANSGGLSTPRHTAQNSGQSRNSTSTLAGSGTTAQENTAAHLAGIPENLAGNGLASSMVFPFHNRTALRFLTENHTLPGIFDSAMRTAAVAALKPEKTNQPFRPRFFAQLTASSDYFDPAFRAGGGHTHFAVASPDGNFISSESGFTTATTGPNTNDRMSGQSQTQLPTALQGNTMGEQHQAAVSFTYGLNVGAALTKNLRLESGINYLFFNTVSRSNFVVGGYNQSGRYPLALNTQTADKGGASVFNYVPGYEMSNSFRFVSVPIRAGYQVNWRGVALTGKGGVAADFFLQNTVNGRDGNLQALSVRPGENSPFKSVLFNGILGFEASRQLSQNYSIALETNYRFALSPFTKDDAMFTSLPRSFGAGFALRYNFGNGR